MTDVEKRGFAAMTEERQREIAAMGGRAVPKYKRTFRRNRALASAAGRKGGTNVPADKRSFCNRDLAKRAGCLGGQKIPAKKRAFACIPGLAKRAGRLGGRVRKKQRVQAEPTSIQTLVQDAQLQSH